MNLIGKAKAAVLSQGDGVDSWEHHMQGDDGWLKGKPCGCVKPSSSCQL